ncbi:MAG TPA: cation diffusion facilitator family transporter [Flavobacteriales bacterium]|nr:cation diffusion facilitator family transporter [Flavobacteriales bacterium]
MTGPRGSIRLQAWVLFIGMAIMAIKFLAWRLTGSDTILSDALESILNVTAGAFALYSLWLTARPRDRGHPYGHGKVEFISAGIEGGLVMLTGVGIIWRAVGSLLAQQGPHHLETGILLTGSAGAINLIMGLVLRRRGRAVHSITMEASGTHLLSDAWSTAAMVIGLLLIRITNIHWLDQLFAMMFAIYIIYTGIRVFRRSVAGIMDESDPALESEVIAALEVVRQPRWIDLHNFRTIRYGPALHIDCHVTLPWYLSLEEAHAEIVSMGEVVRASCSRDVELFMHMDPCVPGSCPICILTECPKRRSPFIKRVEWTLDSVTADSKHSAEQT